MHPSDAIRGRRSQLLAQRRIVVGVSGSIAAVESPRIVRELIRHGADVTVVMSGEASRLVTPESLEFASGHPVITSLTGNVEHVTFLGPGKDRADLLLIVPATANTISKIAHGIDDTPVTSFASVALGGGVPLLLAPAMHAHMGSNPAVRENLARLRGWGVGIIEPRAEEGEEKVASPEEVAAAVLHRLARGNWAGKRVLVIGGPSRESIDDVRSITNESSGALAVALASQAHFRGADVDLWLGAVSVPVPTFLRPVRWQAVGDLRQLVASRQDELDRATAVWVPAALSDFTVRTQSGKIDSRSTPKLTLTLDRAPKILPEIRRRVPAPRVVVGFKLGSQEPPDQLLNEARELLHESGVDWVVANDRRSMGTPEAEVMLVHPKRPPQWVRGPKEEVAARLLDEVGRELPVADARASADVTGVKDRKRPRRR